MHSNRILSVLATTAVILTTIAVPAHAQDTAVAFTTELGVLSVATSGSARLNGGSNTPGGTISGTLGTVTVTDTRGTAQGWTAGMYSTTGFVAAGNPPITNANITYAPGHATAVIAPGVPTIRAGAAGSPGSSSSTARTVYSYANTTAGSNSVSWNPTLRVNIPTGAHPGSQYSGTISYAVA
ncbi:MAG TPA: WxL domain-containing protein [Pseudonocardiaceae bacterium]|nr:WxL domain-containing protein [Pseudonocardiaceae bacterium]